MKKNIKVLSRSESVGARLMHHALSLLAASDDKAMSLSDLREELAASEDFNEWELSVYEKTGNVRWVTLMSFFSSRYFRAGMLFRQRSGLWSLTENGETAVNTYDAERLFFLATELAENSVQLDVSSEDASEVLVIANDYETLSHDDLMGYLLSVDAYVFQSMVAALLHGMGYHIPYVASKGRDGGVDIVAYTDPFGARGAILKVQVKRYAADNIVPVEVVRGLLGVAHNAIPVVVTTSRFSDQALAEARLNNVRLINGEEFVRLWIQYYNNMSEEERALMPIQPFYFIKRS